MTRALGGALAGRVARNERIETLYVRLKNDLRISSLGLDTRARARYSTNGKSKYGLE